jgi:hypothetical protein
MTDLELMQKIKVELGLPIAAAAASSSVPAAFFAALIANESGGNPSAERYEPRVFTALSDVYNGQTAAYGSITRTKILNYVTGPITETASIDATDRLKALATSWGITQIMGYEAIAFTIESGADALRDPVVALKTTTLMLMDFARRFQISLSESGELFDCWNTGRPHQTTYDPKYIPNGLARMEIWNGLT